MKIRTFLCILTLVFVGLKLAGEISWSWWAVLSPLLFPLIFLAIFSALVAMMIGWEILRGRWKGGVWVTWL